MSGEHAFSEPLGELADGSSPRERGAQYPKTVLTEGERIIPA